MALIDRISSRWDSRPIEVVDAVVEERCLFLDRRNDEAPRKLGAEEREEITLYGRELSFDQNGAQPQLPRSPPMFPAS